MYSCTSPVARICIYVVLSALFLAGCQDEETRNTTPKYLVQIPYQGFVTVGDAERQTISVRVFDADSLPRGNISVFFKVASGEVSLSTYAVATDADGYATVDVMFGTKVGAADVIAEAIGLEGSPIHFYFYLAAASPTSLTIVSGNEQEGLPNESLKDELKVHVQDEFGNNVQGATIFFRVTESNGSVFWASTSTRDDGTAYTRFRLGTNPVSKIEASFNDNLKVVFNAYALTPTTLNSLQSGKDRITLKWVKDVNPSFIRYVVYRATVGPYYYAPIAEITDRGQLEFVDESIVPGNVYSYYIRSETVLHNYVTSNYQSGDAGDYVSFSRPYELFDLAFDEPSGKIYVANFQTSRIMILSMATLEKIDSITLAKRPRSIALSNDRQKLYVALQGTGEYCAIDLATKTLVKQLDISAFLGADIFEIYQTSDGQLFASTVGMYVVKVDEAANTARHVGNDMIFFNAPVYFIGDNGRRLFVVGGSGTLTLWNLDLTKPDVPRMVATDGDVNARLSSDGKRLYTTNGRVLDSETLQSDGKLGYGSRIAISKDGKHVYSVSQGFINVYNTNTQLLERQIPFGLAASHLFVNDNETEAIIQVESDYPSPFFSRLYKLPLVD